MKQTLSLFLALVLTFSLCIGLISCGNTNNSNYDNSSENNPGGDDPNGDNSASKPFIVDLEGYVANIGNATALGISKKAKASASPVASYGTKNSGVQLLSFNTLASDKDTEDKNYIVMSTTDYDANSPEADETGLTKVTFTKIVTENVTTETTGTKYIIATEGAISIAAVPGFKYSVYYNDSLVYNEVQDNDANDKDEKVGVIVLNNLIDGIEYKVDYKGIGVETTITQDDINGEIDKLYVLNGYTFISFVPLGTSQRPDDNQMNYDSNGVAVYDKANYFSNNSRQSFVIDNATGYIYQIKDVSIDEIKNNLLLISGKIYDMRVTESDELQFYTVVQNETLTISDYFKDNYGNIYIENDYLEVYDQANNTLYYKPSVDTYYEHQKTYNFTREGYVLKIDYSTSCICPSVVKVGPNFTEEAITINDDLYIDELLLVKDGYFYNTREFKRTNLIVHTHAKDDYSCSWIFLGWHDNIKYDFVDYQTVIFYIEKNSYDNVAQPKSLYYQNIFGSTRINDPQIPEEGDTFQNSILLLENVEVEAMGGLFENWRFKKITISSTIYYQIVVDENGVPTSVNSETYVAPERDVITMQPLNK